MTLFVVFVGTALNMLFSVMFAYVLSRSDLMWHKLITWLAVFTMYFGGGMIPTFLVVKDVGLYNTVWAMIIPGLISTYNCIILRTAIYNVPREMSESVRIDGGGDFRILFSIILPLIVPTIACVSMFYAVSHWNSWTEALLYIRKTELYPLQLVLRSILVMGDDMKLEGGLSLQEELGYDMLKYCTIIIATVPILCIYPFIQKYFVGGIMVGSVKG